MIVIGEKLNASIKRTRQAIERGDGDYLTGLAKRQTDAGSDYLDVNVGTGKNEAESMAWLIKQIESVVDTPLALDTADVTVLAAGLETTANDRVLINSISCERGKLDRFLPYVKQYGAHVIALCLGEQGVPPDVDGRLRNCATIAGACEKAGIPLGNVFFDPLLTPQGTDPSQAVVSLQTITRIKAEFPESKVSVGLSNISHGLPLRKLVNTTLAAMALYAGLDAAILDPLDKKLMATIKAAEMLLGQDRFCKTYIKAFRSEQLAY